MLDLLREYRTAESDANGKSGIALRFTREF
jgi:hypothetical protein